MRRKEHNKESLSLDSQEFPTRGKDSHGKIRVLVLRAPVSSSLLCSINEPLLTGDSYNISASHALKEQ